MVTDTRNLVKRFATMEEALEFVKNVLESHAFLLEPSN